mmetsp:Transcript_13634/g.50805  ORF Transcript_13634/g.50805 Transcript_13634/m.50805 type:complete len:247 (-) Transcript_13634:467-1207(-)
MSQWELPITCASIADFPTPRSPAIRSTRSHRSRCAQSSIASQSHSLPTKSSRCPAIVSLKICRSCRTTAAPASPPSVRISVRKSWKPIWSSSRTEAEFCQTSRSCTSFLSTAVSKSSSVTSSKTRPIIRLIVFTTSSCASCFSSTLALLLATSRTAWSAARNSDLDMHPYSSLSQPRLRSPCSLSMLRSSRAPSLQAWRRQCWDRKSTRKSVQTLHCSTWPDWTLARIFLRRMVLPCAWPTSGSRA